MKLKQTIFMLVLSLVGFVLSAQDRVAIIGATAHIGDGSVVESSIILLAKGKIERVIDLNANPAPTVSTDGYEVIEAEGKHVYPGFIAVNSRLGLVEVEAVRSTRDYMEVGLFNPNVRSLIAYNTDSKVIPTIRTNGVLIAQVAPLGTLVAGTSSIFALDGWNWEDAVYKKDDAVFVHFPSTHNRSGWWGDPGPVRPNKQYERMVDTLNTFFDDAKAYLHQKGETNLEKDLRYEAMRGVFEGTQGLFIHADYGYQIQTILELKEKHSIPRVVIVGGYEAYKFASLLKKNKVSVVYRSVHSLPSSDDDDYDLPFKTPSLLEEAGVDYCISFMTGGSAFGLRNLPFYAGYASAFGLDKEKAVSAISLRVARILGIEDKVGSLEMGKDATLFISKGDALDMRTSVIEKAWIRGNHVDLDNHQKELYRKYKEKYAQ